MVIGNLLRNALNILLTKVVSEVSNGVAGVSDEEVLGLTTIVLIAIDVGENGRDLSVFGRSKSALSSQVGQWKYPPIHDKTHLHPRWQ